MKTSSAVVIAAAAAVPLCMLTALAIWMGGCGSTRRGEPFTKALNTAGDPRLALGQRLFDFNCNVCHPAGAAGYGPSLNDKPLSPWFIHLRVRGGWGAMPPFGPDRLSDDQISDIALYLQHLRGLPPRREGK
jgi:mono/diheme cytochrome c family protein